MVSSLATRLGIGTVKLFVGAGIIIAILALMFTRPNAVGLAKTGISQGAWGTGIAIGMAPVAAKNLSAGINDAGSFAAPQLPNRTTTESGGDSSPAPTAAVPSVHKPTKAACKVDPKIEGC